MSSRGVADIKGHVSSGGVADIKGHMSSRVWQTLRVT